jgi:predicted nuclease of predicted toxin-antitoxin system
MRLLADIHISPRTVEFLRTLGHDVIRADQVLPNDSPDEAIVAHAAEERRTVLTQDLDFSAIIALEGKIAPSLITLRLSSSRVEYVNRVLERILPTLEQNVLDGMIITVEDHRIRRRQLPVET